MNDRSAFWFPAKRHGWGWGLPIAWQGWVVLVAWLAAFIVGRLELRFRGLEDRPLQQVGYLLAMTAILLLVCWWKGEPPRWRWGDDK